MFSSTYMYSRGRGESSYRGRGGRGKPPNIIAQHGKQRLIAKNISSSSSSNTEQNELYNEFQEFLKQKQKNNSDYQSSASYANIIKEDDNDSALYTESKHRELILLIEEKYLQWEKTPWTIMDRYLTNTSYVYGAYKQRGFYENLLLSTKSVDITHFFSNTQQKGSYNFSKLIIKKIISIEEWGISPLVEKEFYSEPHKMSFKFNFWDYVVALQLA